MTRERSRTLYVIAAVPGDALAALRSSATSASDSHDTIEVLVPHVVPYGVPLDGCGCDLHAIGERFRTWLSDTAASTTVRVCACRAARHLPGRLLLHRASIVIAGRAGRVWRSPSERLARACALDGHDVTYVALNPSKRAQEHAQ